MYRAINNALLARIVVDVHRHAAERRDFGGQLVQARVVLALALVGFGHFFLSFLAFVSCRRVCGVGYAVCAGREGGLVA